MGNTCVCFNSSTSKPNSKLIQALPTNELTQTKINGELAQFPKQDFSLIVMNRSQQTNKSHADSFHTANSEKESIKKDSRNSFQGTEYMSFDANQMSILRRSDVRKLSQRLSAAGSSRIRNLKEKNENAGVDAHKRSMSQDSMYFSQEELTKELRESFTFSEKRHGGSQPEIEDALGFSHMTLKDVLSSKDPKVKYAKKIINETNPDHKSIEAREDLELPSNNIKNEAGSEVEKIEEEHHRSKSFTGYDIETVKLNLANEMGGNKGSVEVLDSEPWKPNGILRRSSVPAKELLRKSSSKLSIEKPDFQLKIAPKGSKKVIVEPLSPVVYHNISLREETKGEKDEEGAWSGHASAETHEDDQFAGIDKETMEFIKRGQEILSLILRILRISDNSAFERLYKAKSEAHKLTIYYDSIQKPNGQTIIKVLWSWEAPCSSDKFIQFNSDIKQQLKIDENRESTEEIEEIYSSDTESFVINYVSYKQVLISMPRDVVFLKHIRKLGQGEWAEASVSVKHEDYPELKDHLRSEIICAGSLISDSISGDSCLVKCYSETDFKANIPSFLAKTFIKTNIKNYIERFISALKDYN